jgi:hypothetical protein
MLSKEFPALKCHEVHTSKVHTQKAAENVTLQTLPNSNIISAAVTA